MSNKWVQMYSVQLQVRTMESFASDRSPVVKSAQMLKLSLSHLPANLTASLPF